MYVLNEESSNLIVTVVQTILEVIMESFIVSLAT